jgi:putative resolvase
LPVGEVRAMNSKPGPYRVGEVAEKLGVHRDTVQAWCRAKKLDAIVTKGGHYRIPASALDEFIGTLSKRAA